MLRSMAGWQWVGKEVFGVHFMILPHHPSEKMREPGRLWAIVVGPLTDSGTNISRKMRSYFISGKLHSQQEDRALLCIEMSVVPVGKKTHWTCLEGWSKDCQYQHRITFHTPADLSLDAAVPSGGEAGWTPIRSGRTGRRKILVSGRNRIPAT
jgi:hypothetical protein